MGLFRKKRQGISMSRLFSETLSLALRETNARCVGFYMGKVCDELREPVAQNWEPYVCLLVKYFYTDFLGRELDPCFGSAQNDDLCHGIEYLMQQPPLEQVLKNEE